MSENERVENGNITAFLLGFLTGVLVCLVVGGGFFFVVGRKMATEQRMRAMEAEMMARQAAEERLRAEEIARRSEEALKKAHVEKKAAKAP